jgi:hypothetical protein
MMKFDYLRRRVFIAHRQGGLHVRILHNEGRTAGVIGFLVRELLYLLPLSILLILAYLIVLRIVIWKAFGQEEILVENGVFRWTCTSLWLKDELKIATSDISAVSAVTRWLGDNRVEFTTKGHTYRVGEKILRAEAIQLAHALKRAIGLH